MTRKQIDWERLELQYRAGLRSLKDIGNEFGVSDAAIVKRAKRDGWSRDLKAKIQARAEAKVSEAMVSAQVSAQTKVRERDVVEANATAVASVIQRHRSAIGRHQNLVDKMLTELEALVNNPEAFAALGTMLYAPDENGRDKVNEIYQKVIAMPGRVDSAKKLVETLEKLVKMERESFGLNDAAKGDDDPMAGGRVITDAERAVRLLHILREGGAG